uniref:Uncharacterized protein n=1 Tax=Triticum urartu TaxID=4572 RepID=A0A8R7QQ56_TRIUA
MGRVRRHRPPIIEDRASCGTSGGGENKGVHNIRADEIHVHGLRPACRGRPLHPAPLKVHEQGNPAIIFGHLLSTQLLISHIVTSNRLAAMLFHFTMYIRRYLWSSVCPLHALCVERGPHGGGRSSLGSMEAAETWCCAPPFVRHLAISGAAVASALTSSRSLHSTE